MSFDLDLERDVLARALVDAEFLRTAAPVLSGHGFATKPHTWVWGKLADGFRTSGELPSSRIWAIWLRRDWPRTEERDVTAGILKSLFARRPTAARAALEEVRLFARMSHIRGAISGAIDKLDHGDVDAAERAAAAGLEGARAALALGDAPTLADGVEARMRRYAGDEDPVFKFEAPLPTLTRITSGGVSQGGLALAFAQAGVGKSTFVVEAGFSVALRHPDALVAHFTTEETRADVEARYDARVGDFERRRLVGGRRLSGEDLGLLRLRLGRASKLLARVRVQEVDADAPAAVLGAQARRLRRDVPGAPILLIVDSPDHLSASGSSTQDAAHAKIARIYQGLKAVALDRTLAPVAIWAVTWAPAAYESRRATVNATAGSVAKGRYADFMVHLRSSGAEDEEEDQVVTFDVVKNRYGRVNRLSFSARANLGTCRFEEIELGAEP